MWRPEIRHQHALRASAQASVGVSAGASSSAAARRPRRATFSGVEYRQLVHISTPPRPPSTHPLDRGRAPYGPLDREVPSPRGALPSGPSSCYNLEARSLPGPLPVITPRRAPFRALDSLLSITRHVKLPRRRLRRDRPGPYPHPECPGCLCPDDCCGLEALDPGITFLPWVLRRIDLSPKEIKEIHDDPRRRVAASSSKDAGTQTSPAVPVLSVTTQTSPTKGTPKIRSVVIIPPPLPRPRSPRPRTPGRSLEPKRKRK